jgi:hypothetical protein
MNVHRQFSRYSARVCVALNLHVCVCADTLTNPSTVRTAPIANAETYRHTFLGLSNSTTYDRVRWSVIRRVHACIELGTDHFERVVSCGLINSKN